MPTKTNVTLNQRDAFTQFVHELIGGGIRRNTFTQWELDLLFDLEKLPVRKSARGQILRRYTKAVSQAMTNGAPAPPRLRDFFALEMERQHAEMLAARAEGLSEEHILAHAVS
ncbi:MAG: hypothetical protein JO319_11350 [Acidobacteriaceae bacterium]|nr:hypothetical protein [Acidobacteriaceae bacterium]